jgi:hypothetical protein
VLIAARVLTDSWHPPAGSIRLCRVQVRHREARDRNAFLSSSNLVHCSTCSGRGQQSVENIDSAVIPRSADWPHCYRSPKRSPAGCDSIVIWVISNDSTTLCVRYPKHLVGDVRRSHKLRTTSTSRSAAECIVTCSANISRHAWAWARRWWPESHSQCRVVGSRSQPKSNLTSISAFTDESKTMPICCGSQYPIVFRLCFRVRKRDDMKLIGVTECQRL